MRLAIMFLNKFVIAIVALLILVLLYLHDTQKELFKNTIQNLNADAQQAFGIEYNRNWSLVRDLYQYVNESDTLTFNPTARALQFRRFSTAEQPFDSFFRFNNANQTLLLESKLDSLNLPALKNYLRANGGVKLTKPQLLNLGNERVLLYFKSEPDRSTFVIGYLLMLNQPFWSYLSEQTGAEYRIENLGRKKPALEHDNLFTPLAIPLALDKEIELAYRLDITTSLQSKSVSSTIVFIISTTLLLASATLIGLTFYQRRIVKGQLETTETIDELASLLNQIGSSPISYLHDPIYRIKSNHIKTNSDLQRKLVANEKIIEKLSLRFNEATQALENIEEAPKVTSHFLSRMGEEVTTPMKTLSSMLQLLTEYSFEEEPKELINIARRASNTLINNLNNILDFSQLDAGVLKLNKIRFEPRELVDKTVAEFLPHAQQKQLDLTSEYTNLSPDFVYNDYQRVRQILKNLLGNAIRFTKQGSIKVTVDLVEETKLFISVKDTGIGIPLDAQDSLFSSLELRTRLSNSSFTGRLRLIVSSGLAKLMGGNVGVDSAPGAGSTFWFTIDTQKD